MLFNSASLFLFCPKKKARSFLILAKFFAIVPPIKILTLVISMY